MGENILDLSKVADHDTLTLPDSKIYELINRTDLGVVEFFRLQQMQDQVSTMQAGRAKKKLTAAQEAKIYKLLGDMVKFLIPTVTPRVLAMIPRAAREQIVIAWISRNGEDSSGEA